MPVRWQNTPRYVLWLAALLVAVPGAAMDRIDVTPTRVRAQAGDRVAFHLRSAAGAPHAVLLTPGGGVTALEPTNDPAGGWRLTVTVPTVGRGGLYVVHVWTGDRERPSTVGKATVLSGPIVLDFFLPAYLDRTDPLQDLGEYLDDFQALGGNALVAHAIITPEKAYFPSAIARTDVRRGSAGDIVERLLAQADQRGIVVLLSVSWDMTRHTAYRDRLPEIDALMDELYALYAGHPSLAGFYSYQEGSGTYYVPYVRAFTAHAKALNPGLLTACAPFVDDPLLAGYLSTVESLDMMIFQAQVMASYRPDNRKRYPLRRVRDFEALGVGAKWLQDKIALAHVELFGYLENRPDPAVVAAGYDNIFGQIASVATLPGADGIALFAYHPHIWAERRDPRVQRSRQAVADGLAFFERTQRAIGTWTNALVMYFPYSDWVVERWTLSFLPAVDAFRRAGIPVDILPYAPPVDESEYPYFPFHMNRDVLERLLARAQVLVLPDVSGFQQTDSDLVDAFVRRGGVVVAFGPQIPMGRSFDRDRLFGGREDGTARTHEVRAASGFGRRTAAGSACVLPDAERPQWTAGSARTLASFESGRPAVLEHAYGEGRVIAVLASASDFSRACAPLMRDVLDEALKRAGRAILADVEGLDERADLAISAADGHLSVSIVNHDSSARTVVIRPIGRSGSWTDLTDHRPLTPQPDGSLRIDVAPRGVRMVDLRDDSGGRP